MTKLLDDPKYRELVANDADNWIQYTMDDQHRQNI